jgi:hypothetical protein
MSNLYESQTADKGRLDRLTGLATAGAMAASDVILLGSALSRLSALEPGGSVYFRHVPGDRGLCREHWILATLYP